MDSATQDEENFFRRSLMSLSFPLREYIKCEDVAISSCDQRCLSRSPAQLAGKTPCERCP